MCLKEKIKNKEIFSFNNYYEKVILNLLDNNGAKRNEIFNKKFTNSTKSTKTKN